MSHNSIAIQNLTPLIIMDVQEYTRVNGLTKRLAGTLPSISKSDIYGLILIE